MTTRLAMRCRHCHCTELDPCRLACGDTCGWFNADCSVCTAPGCIKAEQARLAAQTPKPKQKRTPADIHALINKRKRTGLARRIREERMKPDPISFPRRYPRGVVLQFPCSRPMFSQTMIEPPSRTHNAVSGVVLLAVLASSWAMVIGAFALAMWIWKAVHG